MWADLTYAESYFTGRLNTDEWDDAVDATKTKALTMALLVNSAPRLIWLNTLAIIYQHGVRR